MRTLLMMTAALSLSILTSGPLLAQEESPLALLMSPQGEVILDRGGEPRPATWGMHLLGGDVILTQAESSADILFSTGQAIRLGPNGRLEVQGETSLGDDTWSVPPEVVESTQVLVDEGRGGSTWVNVRGETDSEEIVALFPRGGEKVRPGEVHFRWAGSSEEDQRLSVFGEGQKVIWETVVHGAESAVYPQDAPELERGRTYSWQVETDDPLALNQGESVRAYFTVLSAADAAAIEGQLADLAEAPLSLQTRTVMKAAILDRFGLHQEAGDTLASLGTADADAKLQAVLQTFGGARSGSRP